MSHAWGAVVLPVMQESLLGVRPLDPGYARFEVRPPASGLHDASGRVPTDRGPIEVSWTRSAGSIRLRVTVPVNAVAVVRLPGRDAVTLGSGVHSVAARA
jgi:alpha-L-rhamnosidase